MKSYLLTFLLLLLTACQEDAETTTVSTQAAPAIPVEVMTLTPTQVEATLSLFGTLEPMASVSIDVDFSAPITSVLVEEGDRVEVAQPLIQFDLSKLELRKKQLQHNLAVTEVMLGKARRNLQRMKELKRSDAISQKQLDDALAEFESTRASASAIKSELALLDRDLIRQKIYSPVAGMVSKRNIDPNENALAYMTLLELEVNSSLKATVYVGEKLLPHIQVGNSAKVRTVLGESPAEVISIASQADSRTGNYEVKLLVDNKKQQYKAGMGITVSLKTVPMKNQLVLPETALVVDNGEYVVFRIINDTAVRQPIELEYGFNERLLVSSGLENSDVIATNGAELLIDGSQVVVRSVHEH